MFTGIIESTGLVTSIAKEYEGLNITVMVSFEVLQIEIGASVAISGCCLTVIKKFKCAENINNSLTFFISEKSLEITTLSSLIEGAKVNLELAVTPQTSLGGHIVLGHVDEIGVIEKIIPTNTSSEIHLKIPQSSKSFIIKKGSITVDGISLTVMGLVENTVILNLIPHTLQNTIAGLWGVGSNVNIEYDTNVKTIHKIVHEYLENHK